MGGLVIPLWVIHVNTHNWTVRKMMHEPQIYDGLTPDVAETNVDALLFMSD